MKSEIKLEDLVPMDDPRAVFEEVGRILDLIYPGWEPALLRNVFERACRLFRGKYPGYRKCGTAYHDLQHTTACLLAMARLVHGASVQGRQFSPDNLILGLIAAILHDTGYIPKIEEDTGTGAQFTLSHIERSIAFMEAFLDGYGLSGKNIRGIRDCMRCTGLDVRVRDIAFENEELEFLGKALGVADMLGQMADRNYADRLPLLYWEFREGNVPGFDDEFDLMKKTPGFWEFTKGRFASEMGGVDVYMVEHFRRRWGIDRDLYRQAVEANISYIRCVTERHAKDYGSFLNRIRERRLGFRGIASAGDSATLKPAHFDTDHRKVQQLMIRLIQTGGRLFRGGIPWKRKY